MHIHLHVLCHILQRWALHIGSQSSHHELLPVQVQVAFLALFS